MNNIYKLTKMSNNKKKNNSKIAKTKQNMSKNEKKF